MTKIDIRYPSGKQPVRVVSEIPLAVVVEALVTSRGFSAFGYVTVILPLNANLCQQMLALERTLNKDEFLALTYDELAIKTGIPKTTWSKWFNNVRKPSGRRAVQAANGLGIEVSEFDRFVKMRRDRTLEMKREEE